MAKKNAVKKAATKKVAEKSGAIEWTPKLVEVKDIKPTPNNYKIKTELGAERLSISMKLFGNASTVIVNTDFHLIDGNSRLEEEKKKGTKKMWVMWPSRKLTPKEYTEFSAMFDFAKAGEVDMDRIEKELGTTEDFYKKWKTNVPLHLLNKMGAKSPIKELEYPEEGDTNKAEPKVSDSKIVQLFFTNKTEAEFRKIEERLMKKFKVDNTTDLVLKVFRSIK